MLIKISDTKAVNISQLVTIGIEEDTTYAFGVSHGTGEWVLYGETLGGKTVTLKRGSEDEVELIYKSILEASKVILYLPTEKPRFDLFASRY